MPLAMGACMHRGARPFTLTHGVFPLNQTPPPHRGPQLSVARTIAYIPVHDGVSRPGCHSAAGARRRVPGGEETQVSVWNDAATKS